MFKPALDDAWKPNPSLSTQQSTPLEMRITAEKPHLAGQLSQLKKELGEAMFDKYINPIHNLNKSGNTLLITTGSEILRTQIERSCIQALKKSFDVKIIRTVSCR